MSNYKLGVVVGKFQAPEPTESHIALITSALNSADSVLVVIGSNSIKTEIDLIPYEVRVELLIRALYNVFNTPKSMMGDVIRTISHIEFTELVDVHDAPKWSKMLDEKIKNCKYYTTPDEVGLMGGRDSFIDHYFGEFNNKVRFQYFNDGISATNMRQQCSTVFLPDPMFIKGAFYLANNQYPTAYQTVDACILVGDGVLLGRKPNQDKFRFIGGFSDPDSESLEEDALREVQEETGYTGSIDNLRYIFGPRVNDPRYKKSKHCIKTALFVLEAEVGSNFIPLDDMKGGELRLFSKSDLTEDHFMPEHKALFNIYKKNGVFDA